MHPFNMVCLVLSVLLYPIVSDVYSKDVPYIIIWLNVHSKNKLPTLKMDSMKIFINVVPLKIHF